MATLAIRKMEHSAKYYATGLRLGILSAGDVQTWVDAEIAAAEAPSDEIVDLAYAGTENIQDLYAMLVKIKDPSDTFAILRALLGRIDDEQLSNLEFCRRLAEKLYDVWVENDYEAPEDFQLIGFLDDEYGLAKQGIYGSVEAWQGEFKRFVDTFR